MSENGDKTKKIAQLGLLLALSAIGAYFKFPSPVGSIALDSWPGYLAVLILGAKYGALALIIGHLLSALMGGFALGPLHIIIALLMGFCGLAFGYFKAKNLYLATVIAILLNGVVIAATLIPILGLGFYIGITPMLLVASTLNILLAVIINNFLIKGQFVA